MTKFIKINSQNLVKILRILDRATAEFRAMRSLEETGPLAAALLHAGMENGWPKITLDHFATRSPRSISAESTKKAVSG